MFSNQISPTTPVSIPLPCCSIALAVEEEPLVPIVEDLDALLQELGDACTQGLLLELNEEIQATFVCSRFHLHSINSRG